jgi:SDR family mycofactocin-dependent oxidoreductase
MGRLDGKVALITGAGRGQGRAHAITLAREGAEIVAVEIADQIASVDYPMARPADLQETVELVEALDRRILGIQADVRSQEALDVAVSKGLAAFGRLDIAVANAGIFSRAPFWEITDEAWDEMIGVNLTGVWRTAKAVAPHMMERKGGAIVMTSSVNGLEPGANYAHYTAAKHGVIGLMRNVALELAPYGVRCNAVCPGIIDTKMVNWEGSWDMLAGHEGGSPDEFDKAARVFHAIDGVAALSPDVVANAALWLVSDEAAHVTGIALPIDAGHRLLPGVNWSAV